MKTIKKRIYMIPSIVTAFITLLLMTSNASAFKLFGGNKPKPPVISNPTSNPNLGKQVPKPVKGDLHVNPSNTPSGTKGPTLAPPSMSGVKSTYVDISKVKPGAANNQTPPKANNNSQYSSTSLMKPPVNANSPKAIVYDKGVPVNPKLQNPVIYDKGIPVNPKNITQPTLHPKTGSQNPITKNSASSSTSTTSTSNKNGQYQSLSGVKKPEAPIQKIPNLSSKTATSPVVAQKTPSLGGSSQTNSTSLQQTPSLGTKPPVLTSTKPSAASAKNTPVVSQPGANTGQALPSLGDILNAREGLRKNN